MSKTGATATVVAYQQQTQAVRSNVEAMIRALWAALGVYRAAQMREFVGEATPIVLGAQQHMAALTGAYLAEYQFQHLGSRSGLPALATSSLVGPAVRSGTPMAEVYGRPFHLVWRMLAASAAARRASENWTPTILQPTRPAPPPADYVDRAIAAGVDRAVNLALTDIQLTKTNAAQKMLTGARSVTGYTRVLEGSKSCGLCIVAATLVYHKAKLMPVHPGCDCSVEPLYGKAGSTVPPVARDGRELIPVGQLQDVHDAIAERFGAADPGARLIPGQDGLRYRDVLIEHHDGEIGPVLAVRGHKFTGPADLAA